MKLQSKSLPGNKTKNILGIDPGSTRIGYGVISYNCELPSSQRLPKPKVLGYGYIDVQSFVSQGKRLVQLHEDLKEMFNRYNPACIAIESIYFFKNAKTFTPVVESKGVIIFTAAQSNINTYEYTPLQIKQSVSGYGKADKTFVHKLVKSSLDISSNIKPDDASDALAIALCHFRHLIDY